MGCHTRNRLSCIHNRQFNNSTHSSCRRKSQASKWRRLKSTCQPRSGPTRPTCASNPPESCLRRPMTILSRPECGTTQHRQAGFSLREKSPPEYKPPPHPPDDVISVNISELLQTPTILDCGAEGHIVKSTQMLANDTIKPSNMVTEAFSGARVPVTHTGDHISGLFPGCHVVPQSTFNLVAVGPYLDNIPNSTIIMSATLALQLNNINLETMSNATNPRVNLIDQLLATDECGNYRVSIDTVGTRVGPGTLYHTDLLHRPAMRSVRNKLINSARTGIPWDKLKLPNPSSYLSSATGSTPTPAKQSGHTTQTQQATPIPTITTPNHAAQWTSSTTTEKALIELRHIHCALGHPANDVLLQALRDSPSQHHHNLRKYVKLMDRCNVCPMGTQRAEPHPDTATSRADTYLARLILDISGRQPVASLSGCWYFLLIVDARRYTHEMG